MEIDRKELKRRAREAMGLTRPRFWVVALVYFLMTTGLSYLPDQLLSLLSNGETAFTLSLFCSILMSLYLVIVRFSFNLWSLWTSRNMDPGLGSLLQGFSVAGRVVIMEVLIYLRVLGWSLLLGLLGFADVALDEAAASTLSCAAVALLMIAVALPLCYKLGVEKARVVYMAVFLAAFGGGLALVNLLSGRIALPAWLGYALLAAVVPVLVVVMYLSYRTSVSILRKKEY